MLTVNFTLPPPSPVNTWNTQFCSTCYVFLVSIQHHPACAFRVGSKGIDFPLFPPPPSLFMWFACEFCVTSFIKAVYQRESGVGSGNMGNQLGRIEIWFLDFRFWWSDCSCFLIFFFFFGIKFGFLIKLFESNNWIFILIYLFSFFFKYSWKLIGVKRDLILSCFCVNVNY